MLCLSSFNGEPVNITLRGPRGVTGHYTLFAINLQYNLRLISLSWKFIESGFDNHVLFSTFSRGRSHKKRLQYSL